MDTTFERVRIRHPGFNPSMVADASLQVLPYAVEGFHDRLLTPAKSKALCRKCILLRHDNLEVAPISPEELLEPSQLVNAGNVLLKIHNIQGFDRSR